MKSSTVNGCHTSEHIADHEKVPHDESRGLRFSRGVDVADMKKKPVWTRRDFLRAAGVGASVAAVAPFLPLPKAEGADAPKRLILITSAQGTDMTRWRPTGSEQSFDLGTQLSPLEAYQRNLLVLDGVDNTAAYRGAVGGHFGMSTLWTGMGLPKGGVRSDVNVGWPTIASVDRLIASKVGTGTKFDAFYWGLWPTTYASRSNQGPNGIAYHRGKDQPIDVEIYPHRAFERLFDGITSDNTEIEKLRHERKSVIDIVRGELGRIRNELPAGDRARMDAHLDGIRTLERRLESLQPTCSVPTKPEEYTRQQIKNWRLHPHFTKIQFELMSLALACDLTRVACFQWSHSEGYGSFMGEEGYREFGHWHTTAHEMSYDKVGGSSVSNDARARAREDMSNLQHWRAKTLKADLLDKLSPDVRDRTLLVWASEMSEAGTHSNYNIPLVMFQGDKFNYFRTGRYLKWGEYDPIERFKDYSGGKHMNQVLVSMANAMGLDDVNVVGDANISTGPLGALR